LLQELVASLKPGTGVIWPFSNLRPVLSAGGVDGIQYLAGDLCILVEQHIDIVNAEMPLYLSQANTSSKGIHSFKIEF